MLAHNAPGYDNHFLFTKIKEKLEKSVTFVLLFTQKKV